LFMSLNHLFFKFGCLLQNILPKIWKVHTSSLSSSDSSVNDSTLLVSVWLELRPLL
jgi:hypothetical protein